jgi:hypothetical protein
MESMYGIVVTVHTGEHVSAETWVVSADRIAALRVELGEPVVRQMTPVAMTEEMINDDRMVIL